MFFLLPFERNLSKLKTKRFLWNNNAKASFETFKIHLNYLITSLSIEYNFIGEFMTLNQKDPMLFFINLLPNW